jgi:hypothetical protein
MDNIENLSIEDLTALAAEKRAEAAAVAAQDAPSLTDIEAAEAALTEAKAAEARIAEINTEAQALADRAATLRSEFAAEEQEGEDEEKVEAAAETEEPEAEAEVPEETPVETVAARSRVAALAKKVERPKAPTRKQSRVTITAAAEVPDFGAGQDLSDIGAVAEALVSRLQAFGTPTRSTQGAEPDLRYGNVAKFALNFEDDLKVEKANDAMEVFKRAGDETRLEGKSLVAAGGWCTPSENLYDLCEGETLDGLISVPEVQVSRGGINFTKGPDFSTLYNDPDLGFIQTEAQAEAGTTKPCYEIECPPWQDVRLDAVGLCIKVPILTNAAFPELTQRIVRGAMVAHQHKVNASVISRMVTIAGAALVPTVDYTATGQSLWANLSRIAYLKRQQYKMGLQESMEVILPAWTKEAIRDDLAIRGGRPLEEVTDAYMQREFAVRNLAVQFVYDWQELPATAAVEGYPATVNVLMYPAGTFIKGVSDVINLSAVYDAASLAVNVFTGLFFEEGLLVANKCWDADLITIPVCNSGRTGAQSLTVCGTDTTP